MLAPIHLDRITSEPDFGIHGDDTGDNISDKNKWHVAEIEFYWLWKNSDTKIKG